VKIFNQYRGYLECKQGSSHAEQKFRAIV